MSVRPEAATLNIGARSPVWLRRRGRVAPDAVDHGADAIRSLRSEMLIKAERAKSPHCINCKNLLGSLVREESEGDADQSANEVRVAVAAEMKNCHAGVVYPWLLFEPDLAYASTHFVRVIVRSLAQRLEVVAEFD